MRFSCVIAQEECTFQSMVWIHHARDVQILASEDLK